MTPDLHHALQLLERSLAYTRESLTTVGPDRSGRSPCAGWSLADLLAHMDDGLDAFLEAAGGSVRVEVPRRPGGDVSALQTKACALVGVWSGRTPPRVFVGDRPAPSPLIVAAAALEVTVHGWDVAQATGAGRDIPDDLARALMPVAHEVVLPEDRPDRFAFPRRTTAAAGSSDVLLGFLGRSWSWGCPDDQTTGSRIHNRDKFRQNPSP